YVEAAQERAVVEEVLALALLGAARELHAADRQVARAFHRRRDDRSQCIPHPAEDVAVGHGDVVQSRCALVSQDETETQAPAADGNVRSSRRMGYGTGNATWGVTHGPAKGIAGWGKSPNWLSMMFSVVWKNSSPPASPNKAR